MKVIILGATGAVGRDLTQLLLEDSEIEQVDVFVRREPVFASDKLKVHIVDFNHPEQWSNTFKGDVLFSCMGTNRAAAGSKENQYKVDYTYQYNFAKAAADNGVPAYVLVSSAMADSKSRFFYTRMKGELEDAVSKLGFSQLSILRPPSLISKNTTKTIEKISVPVIQFFNKIGLFRSIKPMKTEVVAHAMLNLARQHRSGVFDPQDIWNIK